MMNEIKKLMRQNVFNILVIFLLVIQVFILVNQEFSFSKMHQLNKSIDNETYESYLAYDAYLLNIRIGEPSEMHDYFFNPYFIDDFDTNFHPEYQEYLDVNMNTKRMLTAYPQYIKDILKSSTAEADNRMYNMYKKLLSSEFESENSIPLQALTENSKPNYYLIIFSFILGFYLSHVDKEQLYFYDTISDGIRRLNINKILTIIFYSISFVVISHILRIASLRLLYKELPLQSIIQTIPAMIQSPFNFNVSKLIFISIIWQSFISVILALSIYYISFKTKNSLINSILFIGSLIILSLLISEKSFYNSINLFNPVAQINTFFVFSKYKIFFKTFLFHEILLFIFVLYLVVIVTLILFVKPKINYRKKISLELNFGKHTRIFKHRLQMMLVNYKGILIILILFLSSMTIVIYDRVSIFNDAFINKVQQRSDVFRTYSFEDLESKIEDTLNLEKQIADLSLSKVDDKLLDRYLEEYVENISQRRLEKEVMKLMEQNEIVEPSGYRLLFSKNSQTEDYNSTFLLLLFIIPFLSYLFSNDESEENTKLTFTTRFFNKDRESLFWVGLLFAFISYTIVFGLRLLLFSKVFIFDKAPINTFLWEHSTFPSQLNTYHYLIALFSSRLLGIILLTCFIYITGKRVKSPWKTSLIITVLLLLPYFVSILTSINLSYVSILDLILGNFFLNKSYIVSKIPLILFIFYLMVASNKRGKLL